MTLTLNIVVNFGIGFKRCCAAGRGVPAGEVWDCVKGLRYYLDSCNTYRHEVPDRESVQAFLLKLASKNQSAEQQAQALRIAPEPVTNPACREAQFMG